VKALCKSLQGHDRQSQLQNGATIPGPSWQKEVIQVGVQTFF